MRLRRTSFRGRPASRAATYVELIVTVAIVATIAAIAAPRLARAQDGAASSAAARRLVGELTAIRERAIVSRTKATVRFGKGTGEIRVGGIDTTGLSCADGVIDLSLSPYGTTITRTSFASDQLVFDAYGTPSASGAVGLLRGSVEHVVSVSKGGAVTWE